MGYHPRIEHPKLPTFQTTRSRNSELWFINNRKLEATILGYAAKYCKRYEVKLYALAVEGNHIQAPALFPRANRAAFMRDLNSSVARAMPRCVSQYPGGRFWARRYSAEFLPGPEDVEEYFFYTVLQPVNDGLVDRISEYPGYNCFHDAVHGIERQYQVVNWRDYNAARRFNPRVKIADYTQTVTLKYERLPGYEHLSQMEYAKLMLTKLERRRLEIVKKRDGLPFAGREALLKTQPGSRPRKTKTSTHGSHRPRILSVCPERRAETKAWYFSMYFDYQDASRRYRAGERGVKFPPGMYPPWLPTSLANAPP